MKHRASYWKTTVVALALAVICASGIATILTSNPPAVVTSILCVVLAIPLGVVLLVASGGLMCLWRDARENAGKPDLLAQLATYEPRQPWLRFLYGSRLRPGDVVRVRPLHEIETTLDANRTHAGLPFMPEMEAFAGKVFRVHRRVVHVNDMRHKTGLRDIRDVVTLTGVRCSGSGHGDCQAECQILWKDAWLTRVPAQGTASIPIEGRHRPTVANPSHVEPTESYFCQMTALWEASLPASAHSALKHYLRPLFSCNLSVGQFLVAALTAIFNAAQRLRSGADYPYMPPAAASGATPSVALDLQPGEVVRIRGKEAIARTLVAGRNRGLWFDRDMIRFCGQRAVVRGKVNRLIHEATGKMVVMKTPSIALEGVMATGEFLRICPQHEFIYWREIWLERDRDGPAQTAST